MAAMLTALTEYSNNGDSITYTYTGHSASDPKLVICKRRTPTGNQTMAQFDCSVINATEDSVGAPVDQKVAFSFSFRYPIAGIAADRTSLLATFRDIVASDEVTASLESLNWLK